MANSGKIANIAILNDFVYTILYQSSYEQKRGLKGKYLKAAMNGRAALAFSKNSTREEKEYILAHFGLEFFYVIANRNMTLQRLKDILKKFQKDKKMSAIKDISEEGVFVTSDVEFLKLLGLMSQSIHHPSYFMNLEINRQGYHIQQWRRKQLLSESDLRTRETSENGVVITKTVLAMDAAFNYCKSIFGIQPNELKVLLYLYSYSHNFVRDAKMMEHFRGNLNTLQYRYAIKSLWKSGYAKRQVTEGEAEYSIAGQGVVHVNNFLNYVTTNNNF